MESAQLEESLEKSALAEECLSQESEVFGEIQREPRATKKVNTIGQDSPVSIAPETPELPLLHETHELQDNIADVNLESPKSKDADAAEKARVRGWWIGQSEWLKWLKGLTFNDV